jgi:hypothetical protein
MALVLESTSYENFVALIDKAEGQPKKRGPH